MQFFLHFLRVIKENVLWVYQYISKIQIQIIQVPGIFNNFQGSYIAGLDPLTPWDISRTIVYPEVFLQIHPHTHTCIV